MFFGKIGEDRIIVIAIRRRDKTPALPWIQRVDAELRHRGIVVNAKKIRRLAREHARQ